jgi:phosphoglycerol transferase
MSSAMGICASIGFLYLLAHLIIARNAAKNEILTGLAIVNIIAVLYCTGGGLGSLVAYFVTPTFRGLNRVSFYVAFVSICALVILLDKIWGRLSRKGDRYIYICALCAMGVIGLMDQTSSRFNYGVRHKEIEAEYFNDQQFATRMESLLVKDSMVMQLPLTGFPEYGPRFRMRDYSHLKPYLHSHRLRFSYGAMKGRRESEWHAGVNEKSGQEIYRTAMAMGFKGIYLDRFGFENSSEIEGQISEAAKSRPIMDGRQRYLFWKIGD